MCNIDQILLTGDKRMLLAAQPLSSYAVPLLQSSRQSKQQRCLGTSRISGFNGASMSADRPMCFLIANRVVFVQSRALVQYCAFEPIEM